MKRVHSQASQVESVLETLVENTMFDKRVAKKAEERLSKRNFQGISVNSDVDMLKVSKGTPYVEESHSKQLKLGSQEINFGKLGAFVVIGRHPDTGNIYFAPIIDSGSTLSASIQDTGTTANKMISRMDLLMKKGSDLEFYNMGKNDAIIEAEDKF